MVFTNSNEYLYLLQDLSAVSHTANVLENEINRVLSVVGLKRFAAVVTNNALAISNARKHILEKYPHILNIRCMVHFINLITKDILGIFFLSIVLFNEIKLIQI